MCLYLEKASSTTSSSYHVITASRSIGRRNKWATIPTARVKSLAKSGNTLRSRDGIEVINCFQLISLMFVR